MERSAATSLRCFECGTEWDQPLTETLTAPVCPKCGHVGDRELSVEYPAGVLAGRAAATVNPNLMPPEGAWSEDGEAWFAKQHYPKRSQAMSYFSSFTGIPYIEVRCYSRHAAYEPDHPDASAYDGAYWVECNADHPGAFPVWRCE